ncbi:uncharacterized protein V6R79_002276 [Siganus canaliculatus]
MKMYSLSPVRRVVLLCLLGFIVRTEAKIPDKCLRDSMFRPSEHSDSTVICGTEVIEIHIYLCPVYFDGYNESSMVLNDAYNTPECAGSIDWTKDPLLLKFRLPLKQSSISVCGTNVEISDQVGTGVFSDFSKVQFVNISGTVHAVDPYPGWTTKRKQIQHKFSCLYPMQYLLNNTQLAVPGTSLTITDDNGLFSTLSMQLYKDELYQEMFVNPQKGLDPMSRIYVAVHATNLKGRFNVLLDKCYTAPSPHAWSNTHNLFEGCTSDFETRVELNGASDKARFSFNVFKLVEHKIQSVSTFYLHCVARLCEASSCRRLMSNCGSSMWKREVPYVSSRVTLTSRAIRVSALTLYDDWLPPTGMPAYKQTKEKYIYRDDPLYLSVFDSGSSLICSSIAVVAMTVCNVALMICYSN